MLEESVVSLGCLRTGLGPVGRVEHDVEDLGNVVHRNPFGGQQRGAEYLQRFVLGALGRDAAVEPMASFDFENRHNP